MQIRREYPDQWSIEQIRKFVEGSAELELQGQSRKAVYTWVRATLIHQEYASRKRSEKGLIRGFLSKVSGRSVPQITRLIRQFLGSGEIVSRPATQPVFPRKYTAEDVAPGADRPSPSALEWAGHPAHLAARVSAVR